MKRKTRILLVVSTVILLLAFLAGYWPEHRQRASVETENEVLRTRTTSLEERVRVSAIHLQLLDVIDAVAAMNYGEAQRFASSFFDHVRTEIGRTENPRYRSALDLVLERRDAITAALAKGDASIIDALRESERELRRILADPAAAAA